MIKYTMSNFNISPLDENDFKNFLKKFDGTIQARFENQKKPLIKEKINPDQKEIDRVKWAVGGNKK